jgi:hypothetical protein
MDEVNDKQFFTQKFKKLNEALIDVIDNFSLVNYQLLDITEEESILNVQS